MNHQELGYDPLNYKEIGHESLAVFVSTVKNTIVTREFDHLIAASDSGHITCWITNEVYKTIGEGAPPKLILPIFRHVDKERTILFDNTVLAPQFSAWRNAQLGDVLFVDDEIWRAATLNGVFDVLATLGCSMQSCTIVAEDGGFDCPAQKIGAPMTFIPTKQRIPDVYNAISYITPDMFHLPVRHALDDEEGLNDKHIMCTLLQLPVKERVGGMPQFTTRMITKAAEKIPRFATLQQEYRQWFIDTIRAYAVS